MAHQNDPLAELYDKFREELQALDKVDYYDESQLIDIFDYAGDVNDSYVRFEVLMLWRKLFPDSDELAKREAIFLSTISNDAFRSFMQVNAGRKNDPMWAILRARANSPEGEDAANELRSILDMGLHDDEEIIQFVSLAKHLQQEQWLIDNLAELREKCEYEETLLFEIARLADTVPQVDVAIKILDELTMIEPFNIDYWGLLAEMYCKAERYDEAASALEYAKAVNPDDDELLGLEGYILLKQQRYEEAIEALRKSLAINPDSYSAKRNIATAYNIIGERNPAAAYFSDIFYQDPGDATILLELISLNYGKIEQLLARHYQYVEPDEQTALLHVSNLCESGCQYQALNYLRWFKENFGLTQAGDLVLLELLYINGWYAMACDFICNELKSPKLKPSDLPILSIIVSTLIRTDHIAEALDFCDTWIERIQHPTFRNTAFRLTNRGLLEHLRDIRTLFSGDTPPTKEQIDELLF